MPQAREAANQVVARYRERMRAAGLRPVQFWVPDTRSPEFVKGDPAEAEILKLTEEAASLVEGWE